MKRTLLTLLLILVGSLLLVATAQAANISACSSLNNPGLLNMDGSTVNPDDFTLIARRNVKFEGGPTVIEGNVLVTDVGGFAQLGTNTRITGTLSAETILFKGSKAFVGECESASTPVGLSATNVCGSLTSFNPPITGACGAALSLLLPAACSPNTCVNGQANVTIAAGDLTATLAPGCYGSLRVNNGAILTLGPGSYTFKDVRLITGSSLVGVGPSTVGSPQTSVTVNGLFVTEAGVKLTNLDVHSNSTIGSTIVIGNSSIVTNSAFDSPCGNIHIHSNSTLLECSELIADTLTIEPISTKCPFVSTPFCTCQLGFHPAAETACLPN